MEILSIAVKEINPAEYNPRKDLKPGDPEYEKLKKSILEFDMVEPLVWNKQTGNLVGGHQRLKILQELGIKKVDVSVVDLSPVKEKALNIALNKIQGEWDFPKLKDLLQELDTGGFDMEITGFDPGEIEELMTQFHVPEEGLTNDDEIPEQVETVCKTGDLWQLGEHRLLCGDATKKEDVERLMGGERADMVFTDPPYGINIIKGESGRIGGNNIVKTNLYASVQGDDKPFDPQFILPMAEHLVLWGANNYANRLPNSGHWLVWDKIALAPSQHELSFGDCELAWTNAHNRVSIKIYRHHWSGLVREGSRKEEGNRVHPTQKPVGLFAQILTEASRENWIILDLFGGSGSTLIACEKLGRKCRMMEIDEHYCDVIITRWRNFTGNTAVKIDAKTNTEAGDILP